MDGEGSRWKEIAVAMEAAERLINWTKAVINACALAPANQTSSESSIWFGFVFQRTDTAQAWKRFWEWFQFLLVVQHLRSFWFWNHFEEIFLPDLTYTMANLLKELFRGQDGSARCSKISRKFLSNENVSRIDKPSQSLSVKKANKVRTRRPE